MNILNNLRNGTKELVDRVYKKEVQLCEELQWSNFGLRMKFAQRIYVEDIYWFLILQTILPNGLKRNHGDLTKSTTKWLISYEAYIETLYSDHRGSILINELL